jgi:hypothetical protein
MLVPYQTCEEPLRQESFCMLLVDLNVIWNALSEAHNAGQ